MMIKIFRNPVVCGIPRNTFQDKDQLMHLIPPTTKEEVPCLVGHIWKVLAIMQSDMKSYKI